MSIAGPALERRLALERSHETGLATLQLSSASLSLPYNILEKRLDAPLQPHTHPELVESLAPSGRLLDHHHLAWDPRYTAQQAQQSSQGGRGVHVPSQSLSSEETSRVLDPAASAAAAAAVISAAAVAAETTVQATAAISISATLATAATAATATASVLQASAAVQAVGEDRHHQQAAALTAATGKMAASLLRNSFGLGGSSSNHASTSSAQPSSSATNGQAGYEGAAQQQQHYHHPHTQQQHGMARTLPASPLSSSAGSPVNGTHAHAHVRTQSQNLAQYQSMQAGPSTASSSSSSAIHPAPHSHHPHQLQQQPHYPSNATAQYVQQIPQYASAPSTAASSSAGTHIIPLTHVQSHNHNHYQHAPHLVANGHNPPSSSASSSGSHYSAHPQSHAHSASASHSPVASTSASAHSNPQSPASASASSSVASSSFIRPGDVVYESGPPPAPPAPVVGTRSYTVLKEVGDGSFGTVWLADWHSPLAVPKGTGPPGPSSRPEYKGKRLVALKRMKKAFEGGWDECMKLKELKSLRSIPAHPNCIPLYDAFLLPTTKELYFVFECMEGNLYQLTKSRKGRPLAAGLVASLLQQMLAGLHHIHLSGYFHRDMKPENLLITTTGLADYPAYIAPHNMSNPALANRPPEKDVVAVVKIADFGLARETNSKPPYTEYVSTRWYRAPEVILRSRDYSAPVDMWAVGTILSEMVNLKPLFPGQSEVDQVFRICEVMGDPTSDYGIDERSRTRGGGYWDRATKMAKAVGFSFPKVQPIHFEGLYDRNLVPYQLVDMMADLMRYDPRVRLTTLQCLEHAYFLQIAPMLQPTHVPSVPNHVRQQQAIPQPQQPKVQPLPTPSTAASYGLPAPNSSSFPSPRSIPSSHTHATQQNRTSVEHQQHAARHPYPAGLAQPAPGSAASSNAPYSPAAEYYAAQQRDRQISLASSVLSNDSVGLGGVQVVHGASVTSPGVGYPESINDVSMDGTDDTMSPRNSQLPGPPSPVPSSVYSFGQGPREGSLPPPHVPHHLPQPHHYSSAYQQQLRQSANGYAGSTHSSLYNPSVYSGVSGHSGGSGGRRGSAGGASTFYDGSIFEGIAPTRAASILSLPVTYGEKPPSPNFSLPANYPASIHSHQPTSNVHHHLPPHMHSLRRARTDADNISVDFEREALQRSQNQQAGAAGPQAGMPKSDSQESLKASKGKSGRGWMSNLLSGSSAAHNNAQPHYHPQQQPLINPSTYAASSSGASLHHVPSHASSGTSLKRTPSDRSIHAPEQPPTQPSAPLDPKKAKKEAERLAKEAEKAKRETAQKAARDRARAVMQKRNALQQAADPLHSFGQQQMPAPASKTVSDKEKKAMLEQRKQQGLLSPNKLPQIAEGTRLQGNGGQYAPDARYKARRRDDDDDVHSMSSNETRSERRFSISTQHTTSTFATSNTLDSDPGPARPGRQGGLLVPARRSPSISSFSGQSHRSVGSTNSGHAPQSGYSRRDLSTGGSNASSLEFGLVGRFKGLSAADQGSSSSATSPTGSSHPESPHYYRPPLSASHAQAGHQQNSISLPPIQSFDHPPAKDFTFPTNGGPNGSASAPHTAHSNHSTGSTISAHSQRFNQAGGQLPFTPEMYQHELLQQQQHQQRR